MQQLIKNLREMPFKMQRFIAMAVAVLLINNPLRYFHGLDMVSGCLIAGLIGLVMAHLDDRMICEKAMKSLWKSMILTAIIMLPVSYVQGISVGYVMILVLALIIGPMIMDAYYNLKDALARYRELGCSRGFLEYNDYRICGPALLVIVVIFGVMSKGEPLVVVFLWGLLVWYTLWSLNDELESVKSYCNSVINERERRERDDRDE